MKRYETPDEVAHLLCHHAPPHACSVLDPAVGRGILLKPFVSRFADSLSKVVCIDSDSTVADSLWRAFGSSLGERLHFIHADFLTWTAPRGGAPRVGFDCVVMNPPFAGRMEDLVKVDLGNAFPAVKRQVRLVPIEAAFVAKAVTILRPGGRLLAVLPSSLITSLNTMWLREALIETGCPLLVHELPRRTFKGVDASVFLLVYQKSKGSTTVTLCNSDLTKPERIILPCSALPPHLRLDYSFHRANLWYKAVRALSPTLGWAPVASAADVYRGSVGSPIDSTAVLHTVHRHNAFWRKSNREACRPGPPTPIVAQRGDIVVARVGRHCAMSSGLYVGRKPVPCSDCLLIARPKKSGTTTRLLLAIRAVLGGGLGSALLESGTGASYIAQQEFASLEVPFNLQARWPRLFNLYEGAIRQRDATLMESVESRVRKRLTRLYDSYGTQSHN
jgi:tRNA1(Val) A37 N6-methylase TrmN6